MIRPHQAAWISAGTVALPALSNQSIISAAASSTKLTMPLTLLVADIE